MELIVGGSCMDNHWKKREKIAIVINYFNAKPNPVRDCIEKYSPFLFVENISNKISCLNRKTFHHNNQAYKWGIFR